MAIPRRARRVYFPAFHSTAWEEVELPEPAALGPQEVLLRVGCSVVSAGTELAVFGGTHVGFSTPGATYPRMPFRPGYASAGTIEAVGSAVTAWQVGDRVSCATRHQDWAVVDASAQRPTMARLPAEVSFEQGSLARLAQIPLQGVRLARVRLGEHAAVFGQGLIGQLARQFVQLDGAATAVALDLADRRLDVARADGATHTINPGTVGDVQAAIREATDGQGLDVAIEATGSPAVIIDALQAAADLGRVILLGSPRGKAEIDVYRDIHRKGVSLIGAHGRTSDVAPN
jgi:threonine dehydrogenase-like Zn-dependent dehydrogenase